ncbi:MAG: hypothetical protein RIB64_17325, partial [Arenibacter algicola]
LKKCKLCDFNFVKDVPLTYPNVLQRSCYGKWGRQGNVAFPAAPVAKAIAFCSWFFYFKSQIKRFGGLEKHAQANRSSA